LKTFKNFILLIVLTVMAFSGQAAKITSDELKLGKPGSSADKYLRLGDNRWIRSNETTNALEFSNDDGSIVKKIGSGSGAGGAGGGVNLVGNSGFEDVGSPVDAWTCSGNGTFTQESYSSGTESNKSFLRIVASDNTAKCDSDSFSWSDTLDLYGQIDSRYKQGDDSFSLKLYKTGEATPVGRLDFGDNDTASFQNTGRSVISGLTTAGTYYMAIEASAPGTLDLDDAFAGSNKGVIDVDSQNVCSVFIQNNGAASVLSDNGNCVASVNRIGAGLVTVNFTAGFYTVNPVIAVALIADTIGNVRHIDSDNVTTSGFDYATLSTGGAGTDMDVHLIITKQGVDAQKQNKAVTYDTSRFFVKASIGGANISGASTGVVVDNNASLDMVLHKGSAKIGCSGGNPSTGLTCSAGNEQLSIETDIPSAGEYKYCFNWTYSISTNSTGFRLSQTGLIDDSIIQQGTSWTGGDPTGSTAHRLCERFSFSTSGAKMVKLFREANGNGTYLLARGSVSYENDMSITVEKVGDNKPTPILIGGQAYQGDQNKRLKIWSLGFGGAGAEEGCTSSPCTIFVERGPVNDWIMGNVTRGSVGAYAALSNAVFKPNEYVTCLCQGSGENNNATSCFLTGKSGQSTFRANGSGVLDFGGFAGGGGIATSNTASNLDSSVTLICFSEE